MESNPISPEQSLHSTDVTRVAELFRGAQRKPQDPDLELLLDIAHSDDAAEYDLAELLEKLVRNAD